MGKPVEQLKSSKAQGAMATRVVLPEIKTDLSINLNELGDFSDRLALMMDELRDEILAPKPRKTPPRFTASQVGTLCGLDRGQVNYLATKPGGDLPPGTVSGAGRSRTFTLEEARVWVMKLAGHYERPKDVLGELVLLANFKGGSTKTSTTMSLAQALTLRGRKVLVVDLDPQSSLTELCGLYAEKDITESDTVLPYIYGEQDTLDYAVQSTYWDGLSVIAASRFLFDAEFTIAHALKKENFPFWDILNEGLQGLRKDFDYILIDTAPTLSFLTLNAIMAANAVLMPLVPESLDFISSVQFWRLLSDLSRSFMNVDGLGEKKRFDFIHILHSKVDTSSTSNAPVVKAWTAKAYGDWVLKDIEIPFSTLVGSEALEFSTVYDIDNWTGGMKTLQRIKEPFDRLSQYVDDRFVQKWKEQA